MGNEWSLGENNRKRKKLRSSESQVLFAGPMYQAYGKRCLWLQNVSFVCGLEDLGGEWVHVFDFFCGWSFSWGKIRIVVKGYAERSNFSELEFSHFKFGQGRASGEALGRRGRPSLKNLRDSQFNSIGSLFETEHTGYSGI